MTGFFHETNYTTTIIINANTLRDFSLQQQHQLWQQQLKSKWVCFIIFQIYI